MPKSWPTTPLAAAQRAFDLLTVPPTLLVFDCRGRPSLPQRILPVDALRRVLIADNTPRTVRDAVWRELVTRARRDGPAWVVATVGIAMPGLRRAAGTLSSGWPGDSSDRDSELLTGFLARLDTVDLDEPRICGRLIDAGVRAVKRARARDEELDAVRIDSAWSIPPRHPWDHPDWVLARAVAAAVIDPDEALLISATRLDDTTLQTVADTIGINVSVAAAWRRKAEHRLATALRDDDISTAQIHTRRSRCANVAAEARINGLTPDAERVRASTSNADRLDGPTAPGPRPDHPGKIGADSIAGIYAQDRDTV